MRRLPGWALFALGGVSLFLCAAGAFAWVYTARPRRLILDEEWCSRQSPRVIEEMAVKAVRRTGWFHDDGSYVGGNYEWVASIIEDTEPDDPIGCTGGHLSSVLSRMTNQKVGETVEEWRLWWEKNKHKTQAEWIRDGFAQDGLVLDAPMTKGNQIALLRIVAEGGRGFWSAFRWLRDSDFSPYSLSVADLPREDADVVLKGLLSYMQWATLHPKREALFVLPIGEPVEQYGYVRAPICSAWLDVAAWSGIVVLLAAGAACIWLGVRRRSRTEV